jgi:predicted regulator of Ras-like GTPase activity (Roadblock/LC7/MglB family)
MSPAAPGGVTPAQRQLCHDLLQVLLKGDGGFTAASIATVDGFEVASVGEGIKIEAGKLAAITSSLQALGGAVAGELALEGLESVVVEAKAGRMMCIEIRLPGQSLVLATVASKRSMLARNFFASRDCAARIVESWRRMG